MNPSGRFSVGSSCLVSVILRGINRFFFFFFKKCLFSSAFLKRNKGVFPSSLVFVSLFSPFPFSFAKDISTFKKQNRSAGNSGLTKGKTTVSSHFKMKFRHGREWWLNPTPRYKLFGEKRETCISLADRKNKHEVKQELELPFCFCNTGEHLALKIYIKGQVWKTPLHTETTFGHAWKL